MRVRLLKGHKGIKQWVIGNILNVTNSYAEKLISEGIAEKYSGEYPPKQKMKTEIFKPK